MTSPNLRASSSGFAWGRMVFTKYKTACLRKILVQAHGYEEANFPEQYARLGKLNEDRHARRIDCAVFEREKEFTYQIPHTDVTLTGHCDFLVTEHDGSLRVDELKSVSSTNTRREVIRKGLWVPENLAQLTTYMVAFGANKGRLIYSFYAAGDDEPTEERVFIVTIDNFNRILVDGAPTRYTYYDVLAHREQAATAIQSHTVPQRPDLWDAPFASPCQYCPHSAVCDAYDLGNIEGATAFIQQCKGA